MPPVGLFQQVLVPVLPGSQGLSTKKASRVEEIDVGRQDLN